MSSFITDEDIIKHKKKAIKELNNMFEVLINSPNPKHKKKADLISYWMETYCKYLLSEEKFDYKTLPSYKRGEVVSLNFGFNVGSEHGGLHYAIVLDNDNKQASPVITVVPLSSGNEKDTYNRDIFLGNELYDKLNSKFNKFNANVTSKFEETRIMLDYFKNTTDNSNDNAYMKNEIEELISNLKSRINKLGSERKMLDIYSREIAKLKQGSIALMEQITTVSKMRIYKPKSSSDLLYDIKFSDGAMDKINDRLKELYIYEK